MIKVPQLCLGTVQFGLPYGITNKSGQVSEDEVRRILALSVASGITFLDTAQAYGKAEKILGKCWPKDAPRRLISKLSAGSHRNNWEKSLMSSLEKLRASKLDSFLLHRSQDLLATEGEDLMYWLESLRDRGVVERVGVSIYNSSELDGLPLERLQLVQLPLSIYDQRLIQDGTLNRLQDKGIAVHVRSVFLQGLLLEMADSWPNHLSFGFRKHHSCWIEYLQQRGQTRLSGALDFVRSCQGVEAVLCGVVSACELAEVLSTWQQLQDPCFDSPQKWAWENVGDLDPRLWPPRSE